MANKWQKITERGSMMVEALAMLGLITMVTPVLYKKAAERTTELQDINTATQMRTLSKALDDYIADNYDDLGYDTFREVAYDDIRPYLPAGFNEEGSRLFGDYKFSVRLDIINEGTSKEHNNVTGVVFAAPKQDISSLRTARIASMVGANGGVVREGSDNEKQVQGVQGGWGGSIYNFVEDTESIAENSLAISSVHAITSAGGGSEAAGSEHVLYRDDSNGVESNTMQTTLYMGGNNLEDVSKIVAASSGGVDGGGDGAVLIEGNLETTGNINATNATLTELLTAGSAKIEGTITGDGKLTITKGGAEIKGDTSIEGATTITGDTKINDKVTISKDTGKLEAAGTAKISGGTDTQEAYDVAEDNASLTVDGSMLVDGNMRIARGLHIGGMLRAMQLFGVNVLGGGEISDGSYNFTALPEQVRIVNPNFEVADRLSITDNESRYTGPNGVNGVIMSADSMILGHGSGSMIDMNDTGTMIGGTDVDIRGDSIRASVGNNFIEMRGDNVRAEIPETLQIDNTYGGEQTISLRMAPETVLIYDKIGSLLEIDSTHTALGGPRGIQNRHYIDLRENSSGERVTGIRADKVYLMSDNLYVDDDDLVLDDTRSARSDSDKGYGNRTSGVRMAREGFIQLPGAPNSDRSALGTGNGRQDVPGYIKADRLLANQPLDTIMATGFGMHYDGSGTNASASHPYDAYQVNPAYTSVMHDIKLTTRGGARLSDILPDFINKGIYVLDNTYEESKSTADWTKYTVSEGTGGNPPQISGAPGDCTENDMDCIASPWLGFVPAPQCPPGYSKVVTINPIRWKMSEAYYIAGAEPTSDNVSQRFNAYFQTLTNPLNAKFELDTADGSSGSHTHSVKSGTPLTFQTNTWLNTTVSKVSSSAGNFLGWHAIMGFLYDGGQYSEWLNRVNPGTSYTGKIVWNLFPVRNQEMAAIANVYCYFERRQMTNPTWSWNNDVVDGGSTGYDQLTNFRSGFLKNNSGYRKRLNDPALEYDEVW